MTETKIEVKDLFLRYWEHKGNNRGGTKKIKELFSARAIIVLNDGAEREIRVPKNENCNVLVSDIEVSSLLFTESRRI